METKMITPFKLDWLGIWSIVKTSLIALAIVIVLNFLEQVAHFDLNEINVGKFNLGFLQNYYNIAFVFIAQFLKKWLTTYESKVKIQATEILNQ